MDKVMPRNNPNDQAITQDNVQKTMCYIPGVANYEGNESGETVLIPGTGTTAPFAAATYINITASAENRAAQYKNPQNKQEVPADAQNQYQ